MVCSRHVFKILLGWFGSLPPAPATGVREKVG